MDDDEDDLFPADYDDYEEEGYYDEEADDFEVHCVICAQEHKKDDV